MITEFTEKGRKSLGLSIGTPAGRSLARLTSMRDRPGWLVEGSRIDEWRFEGYLERQDGLYLYGPHHEGMELESVLSLPLEQAIPHVRRLAEALLTASGAGIPSFPLQTDGVFFTKAGVLFLPPDALRELRALRTFRENRETFESINHPDLKGEAMASFSIAALLYRIATSRFPFGGDTAEEIHEQARKKEILSPQLLVPELPDWCARIVMEGLSRGSQVPLSRWQDELAARAGELRRDVTAEERERLSREGRELELSTARKFKRRMFFEKNSRLLLVLAAVAVIAGIAAGSIVKRALAPRPTHGFSPRQVVETFYTSMNTLDHTIMQACVTGSAGQGEINEATNLFIMSRVNVGYTGKSTIVSADAWNAKGRPALTPPTALYGVTDLTVTPVQGEPEPVFQVVYDKWYPVTSDDTNAAPDIESAPASEGAHITDRVYLKKLKEDWVIYKIDRLSAADLGKVK